MLLLQRNGLLLRCNSGVERVLYERSAEREKRIAQAAEALDLLVFDGERGYAVDDVGEELEVVGV